MFSVATELRRRGLAHAELPQMQQEHYSMISKARSFKEEGELSSWKALSTYHEAAYVLELRNAAGQMTTDGTETDSYSPKPPPSECDESMDITVL